MTTTAHGLEEEVRYYYAHKADLLARHENRFVLIKGPRVLGAFAGHDDAIEAGLRAIGYDSFLVKHVIADEPAVFSTLDLGPGLDVDLQP